MKKIILFGIVLNLTGCVSAMSELNRRPFADKVSYLSLQKLDTSGKTEPQSISEDVCNKQWFKLFGSDPTFDEITAQLSEMQVTYLTQVKSLEWGESGFLGGYKCVGFEGEAH